MISKITKILIVCAAILLLLIVGIFAVYKKSQERQRQIQAERKLEAEQVKVTIPEGKTVTETASLLEEKGVLSKDAFLKAQASFGPKQYPWLSALPKNSSLEGFLFPDTYFFRKAGTADDAISKMLDNFEKKFNSAETLTDGDQAFIIPGYESLNLAKQGRGLSLYQVMTLASIVEKETGGKQGESQSDKQARLITERKIIAGIFYNRLLKGQALESDATISYITGKNDPSSSSADLNINSPYNTYKYAGLPPTPICNPSLSSIQAVLNPTKTDYYYFLHIQPSGEVIYSKTFAEHIQNKQKYLK